MDCIPSWQIIGLGVSGSLSNKNELRSARASATAKQAPRLRLEVRYQFGFCVITVYIVMGSRTRQDVISVMSCVFFLCSLLCFSCSVFGETCGNHFIDESILKYPMVVFQNGQLRVIAFLSGNCQDCRSCEAIRD